ncbi:MAG: helix-turn-helix domain-containing protein, partial [Nocardioides sp.]
IARALVVPPHRSGGQAQFVAAPRLEAATDRLGDLLDWCRRHLDQPIAVPDLATRAGLSPRQLTRRFVRLTGLPPQQWLHAERVRTAQELLETSDAPIEEIAARCGMGTATTLRRHFRATVGVTPTAYRETFARTKR